MSDVNSLGSTAENLAKALNVLRNFRCNLLDCIIKIFTDEESLAHNAAPGEVALQDPEGHSGRTLSSKLAAVGKSYKELKVIVGSLTPPIGSFNLGNTSFVSQEVAPDRIPLYSQLIDSYKWTDKVRTYAEHACPILSQNSLKRTFFNASISAKRRRTLANSHVATPEFVNNTIIGISNSYNDMDINITRPLGSNAALNITLGHTLKAVVILKGWLIEWVVIRAFNEDMTKEDGALDLWSESRYKVFQKVTDNANAAMIHFCAPNYPELSVRSFMSWLHSYITLFSQRCKKCSLHMCTNKMPPTWRDFRSLEAYHEECKP